MRNEKRMFKILKRILDKDNMDEVKKHIIYPDENGYVMYDEYIIKSLKSGDFTIEKFNTYTSKHFNSLRNAVMWATLDKSNKIMYAKKVEELDILLASTDSHIQIQKRLLKSTKSTDSISLAYTKLNEESLKKNNIVKELEHFVGLSKVLQEQRFDKLTK
jgi:hypothetical protein